MELKELYTRYGELQIQFEILQNQVIEVKRQIADKLNQQHNTKQLNQYKTTKPIQNN